MKSITSVLLAGVILTAMSIAAAAQSSPGESFRVAEAGSCRGWFSTCNGRCSGAKCGPGFCSGKLAECRQSGCFKEGADYGGAEHCGLKK
jgi:hypothetical protein